MEVASGKVMVSVTQLSTGDLRLVWCVESAQRVDSNLGETIEISVLGKRREPDCEKVGCLVEKRRASRESVMVERAGCAMARSRAAGDGGWRMKMKRDGGQLEEREKTTLDAELVGRAEAGDEDEARGRPGWPSRQRVVEAFKRL